MSPRAWVYFATVSVVWGVPYLFIKVAVQDGLSPGFLSWARVALAAVVLLTLAHHAGLLGTLHGRWRAIAAYAVVEIALPFPLIAAGEQRIDSSLAAIIIACVPLIVALMAVRFDRAERATGRRLAGLLLGLAGVVALVGIDVAGSPEELLGAGAVLVAAVGYGAGPLILKRHMADLDPRATMGASLGLGTLMLAPAAALSPPHDGVSANGVAAVLVLGLLCTAAAFVLMGALVAAVGPGKALVVTYVNPLVAVILGVAVLGERLGVGAIVGLLLILAGSWLSTDGRLPPWLRPRRDRSPSPARS